MIDLANIASGDPGKVLPHRIVLGQAMYTYIRKSLDCMHVSAKSAIFFVGQRM